MTAQEEMLCHVLEMGYLVVEEDYPGLPKEEWMKELIAIFVSDRDFWMAAHPGGTMAQFVLASLHSGDNPMRQAAEAVMTRQQR